MTLWHALNPTPRHYMPRNGASLHSSSCVATNNATQHLLRTTLVHNHDNDLPQNKTASKLNECDEDMTAEPL